MSENFTTSVTSVFSLNAGDAFEFADVLPTRLISAETVTFPGAWYSLHKTSITTAKYVLKVPDLVDGNTGSLVVTVRMVGKISGFCVNATLTYSYPMTISLIKADSFRLKMGVQKGKAVNHPVGPGCGGTLTLKADAKIKYGDGSDNWDFLVSGANIAAKKIVFQRTKPW